MAWTIGVKTPRNLAHLNDFFLIVGRALYCATAFEMKCRAIFKVIRVGDIYARTPDFDAACEVVKSLKDKMLHDTLAGITTGFSVKPDDAEKLDMARQARNYIAHEGSYIGAMFDTRIQDIQERLELLRAQVQLLAVGDNIVSRWLFELDEDEIPPLGYKEFYAGALEDWIFGGPASFDGARMLYSQSNNPPGS